MGTFGADGHAKALFPWGGLAGGPCLMLRELQLSLFPVVTDGQVHVLVGGQEDLELGLGTGASHLGQERGGVQAAGAGTW